MYVLSGDIVLRSGSFSFTYDTEERNAKDDVITPDSLSKIGTLQVTYILKTVQNTLQEIGTEEFHTGILDTTKTTGVKPINFGTYIIVLKNLDQKTNAGEPVESVSVKLIIVSAQATITFDSNTLTQGGVQYIQFNQKSLYIKPISDEIQKVTISNLTIPSRVANKSHELKDLIPLVDIKYENKSKPDSIRKWNITATLSLEKTSNNVYGINKTSNVNISDFIYVVLRSILSTTSSDTDNMSSDTISSAYNLRKYFDPSVKTGWNTETENHTLLKSVPDLMKLDVGLQIALTGGGGSPKFKQSVPVGNFKFQHNDSNVFLYDSNSPYKILSAESFKSGHDYSMYTEPMSFDKLDKLRFSVPSYDMYIQYTYLQVDKDCSLKYFVIFTAKYANVFPPNISTWTIKITKFNFYTGQDDDVNYSRDIYRSSDQANLYEQCTISLTKGVYRIQILSRFKAHSMAGYGDSFWSYTWDFHYWNSAIDITLTYDGVEYSDRTTYWNNLASSKTLTKFYVTKDTSDSYVIPIANPSNLGGGSGASVGVMIPVNYIKDKNLTTVKFIIGHSSSQSRNIGGKTSDIDIGIYLNNICPTRTEPPSNPIQRWVPPISLSFGVVEYDNQTVIYRRIVKTIYYQYFFNVWGPFLKTFTVKFYSSLWTIRPNTVQNYDVKISPSITQNPISKNPTSNLVYIGSNVTTDHLKICGIDIADRDRIIIKPGDIFTLKYKTIKQQIDNSTIGYFIINIDTQKQAIVKTIEELIVTEDLNSKISYTDFRVPRYDENWMQYDLKNATMEFREGTSTLTIPDSFQRTDILVFAYRSNFAWKISLTVDLISSDYSDVRSGGDTYFVTGSETSRPSAFLGIIAGGGGKGDSVGSELAGTEAGKSYVQFDPYQGVLYKDKLGDEFMPDDARYDSMLNNNNNKSYYGNPGSLNLIGGKSVDVTLPPEKKYGAGLNEEHSYGIRGNFSFYGTNLLSEIYVNSSSVYDVTLIP